MKTRSRLIVVAAGIVFMAALAGCNLEPPFRITPPEWILGRWTGYVPMVGETWTWEFTDSTVLWTTSMGSLDFFEYQKNDHVLMEEIASTSSEYRIEVVESGEVFVFRFVQQADSTLSFYDSYNGMTFGPMTFTRNN